MKNKSLIRKAVIIAGFTAAIAGLSSIYNEAAASGGDSSNKPRRPLMKSYDGTFACNGSGDEC